MKTYINFKNIFSTNFKRNLSCKTTLLKNTNIKRIKDSFKKFI